MIKLVVGLPPREYNAFKRSNGRDYAQPEGLASQVRLRASL